MSNPVDQVVADLQARIKALETKAQAGESKVMGWLKSNWAHFVTWTGIVYSMLKHL